MKAIKIDVEKQQVYEVEHDGSLNSLYKLIGCETICSPNSYHNGDVMYADDESLLNPEEIKGGFRLPSNRYPIVGNAVICGTKGDGEDASVRSDVKDFLDRITWMSKEECLIHTTSIDYTITSW